MPRWSACFVCAILSLWTACADAQPRPSYSPTSNHIFPAGTRRGTQVEVRVGAECIPPGTEFQVHGSGLSIVKRLTNEITNSGEPSPQREPTLTPITYPREWASTIEVPQDIELGPVFWRLHCAQGGTASRPFVIGDLAEHIESESNSTHDRAERVELPITLNGQIHGERDVDHFRFKVEAGQSVTCEVMAARLGSPLDAMVALLDQDGRQVDAREYFSGNDPVLVFRSPTTSEYILRVANVTHRGDPSFVYRVNVRPEPFLRAVFPGGGQPGLNQDFAALILTGDDRSQIEQFATTLPQAAPKRTTWSLPFGELGTLPIAADRHRSVSVLNNKPTTAVEIPSHLYGQFANKDDADEFRLTLKQGENIRVECQPWPPGSAAYPVVELKAADGKRLAKSSSVDAAGRNAELRYSAKSDETVMLRIHDLRLGSQGAVDFTYRATIEPDLSDFDLSIATDSLTALQGQDTTFSINVKRRGGFDQPIVLDFLQSAPNDRPDGATDTQQLPAGVTLNGQGEPRVEIAKDQAEARIKLTVSADAPSASYAWQIVGRCEVDGKEMRRVAQCRHLGVDSEGVAIGTPDTELFHLSVQHKPLFTVECSEHYQYAYRGSVYPYEMEIERLDGFAGAIFVQRGDRQNRDMDGVEIWNATLEPGQSKVIVPIYLPETMAINVQSQSQLYSQAWAKFTDKHGQEQSMLILANKRNMLRSMPPVVKLRSIDASITAKPGETIACHLLLKRTSNFPGPMSLQLLDEAKLAERGIHVASVEIAAEQTEIEVPIRFAAEFDKREPLTLQFRATGELDKFTIVSETNVEVDVPR